MDDSAAQQNSFHEDLADYEFQVKVTFQKPDITETFYTMEDAKAFAHDQLKDSRVTKVAIKKVVPDEVEEAFDPAANS